MQLCFSWFCMTLPTSSSPDRPMFLKCHQLYIHYLTQDAHTLERVSHSQHREAANTERNMTC
jgi:hypothetical protein